MYHSVLSNSETKTREDAYVRVANARVGCFDGTPTREYLEALRFQLTALVNQVDLELSKINPVGSDDYEPGCEPGDYQHQADCPYDPYDDGDCTCP